MRTVYPLGTTVYRPEKCCNGYTVLNRYRRDDPWSSARIFQTTLDDDTESQGSVSNATSDEHSLNVIDMNGRSVHGWDVDVLRHPQILNNGNIVMTSRNSNDPLSLEPTAREIQFGAVASNVVGHACEYDWNGQLTWECVSPTPEDYMCSQALRMANGNTLFAYKTLMPDRFRQQIKDPHRRNMDGILSGCICEVTSDKKVVWDWRCHDPLDLNGYCPNDPNPNWMHTNTIHPLPGNRHFDVGDVRFRPGNVLVSGRSLGFIFIIDRESGDIVWRYCGQWKGGLAGQHSPHMIEKGLAGAGNIIVYDNGQSPLGFDRHGGMTAILEIDPVRAKEVWVYENDYLFFSSYGGHCQRLPNGNTLITEPYTCRVFEITLEGEIVWEHVCDPASWLLIMDTTRVPYDHCSQLKAMGTPTQKEVIPPPHINTNPKPIPPCPHHQIK